MANRSRKILITLALGVVVLLTISVVLYGIENRRLSAERSRVCSLVHVGQNISDAHAILRRNGFRCHGGAPTRYLSYQQLLVVIDGTEPSGLDTLFYVIGSRSPLRTQSPNVAITANLDGVITAVD